MNDFETHPIGTAKRIEKLEAELKIKSEFLSSRQCPDHSGKWARGSCLQCAIEKLEAENKRLREYHEVNLQDTQPYGPNGGHQCFWRVCVEAIASRSKAALEQSE